MQVLYKTLIAKGVCAGLTHIPPYTIPKISSRIYLIGPRGRFPLLMVTALRAS